MIQARCHVVANKRCATFARVRRWTSDYKFGKLELKTLENHHSSCWEVQRAKCSSKVLKVGSPPALAQNTGKSSMSQVPITS